MRKIAAALLLILAVTIGGAQCAEMTSKAGQELAWWTLFYERPNPERLPVRVEFRLAKGLESDSKRR